MTFGFLTCCTKGKKDITNPPKYKNQENTRNNQIKTPIPAPVIKSPQISHLFPPVQQKPTFQDQSAVRIEYPYRSNIESNIWQNKIPPSIKPELEQSFGKVPEVIADVNDLPRFSYDFLDNEEAYVVLRQKLKEDGEKKKGELEHYEAKIGTFDQTTVSKVRSAYWMDQQDFVKDRKDHQLGGKYSLQKQLVARSAVR